MFKLPRSVGYYNDEEIVAAIGRFGPYPKYKSKFYSLKASEYAPLTISLKMLKVTSKVKSSKRKKE